MCISLLMSSKHTTLLTKTDAVSMVYNRHHSIMARSTYVFPTEEDYNDARDHIYQTMRDDYYDNNKIWFRDYWGSCSRFDWDRCWRICIEDDCTNPELAASIFREHRGRFYPE